MNNNQSRKKNKHIKKEKKKESKQKEEERTDEFQEGFVDLISYSEPQSVQEQIQVQNRQIDRQQEKAQKKAVVWPKLPTNVQTEESIMVIGSKNTGKSTLCSYLQNKSNDVVLLDCDIGKNSSMDGCVSLIYGEKIKRIWIGQLTPVNNLHTYLRAIRYLYFQYRQIWFGKRLVINTMGYTTGLGEFLIYEIYHILKPKLLFVLKPPQINPYDPIRKIISKIQSGKYIEKLYLSRNSQEEIHATSTKVQTYENKEAISKKGGVRFEKYFGQGNISHLCQLIQTIRQSQLQNVENKLKFINRKNMMIYEQRKHKKEQFEGIQRVIYIPLSSEQSVDMRLIVLGRILEDSSDILDSWNNCESKSAGLFQVEGLGYCFQDKVYSKIEMSGLVGVVSQGIDFEKGFYHLNEKQLIDLELRWGRMNYILVSTKTLGSKGVRNNPSKAI